MFDTLVSSRERDREKEFPEILTKQSHDIIIADL